MVTEEAKSESWLQFLVFVQHSDPNVVYGTAATQQLLS